jgi:MYXO-CTERM domain-containing protein
MSPAGTELTFLVLVLAVLVALARRRDSASNQPDR